MRKQVSIFLLRFIVLTIILFMTSCSAQEEELNQILQEVNISDCNYSFIPDTEIVKSKIKFLASTQIFDTQNKQGILSAFFEVEYNGHDYSLNFHTESNIFDNYLGFRDADISKHEVIVSLYFQGGREPIKIFGSGVDLLESKSLIKPDSFIGYTFQINNVASNVIEKLSDTKLVKFSIHEDMFGIYSLNRKDISKEIKCVTYAKN